MAALGSSWWRVIWYIFNTKEHNRTTNRRKRDLAEHASRAGPNQPADCLLYGWFANSCRRALELEFTPNRA